MKIHKKILTLLFTLIFLAGITACSGNTSANAGAGASAGGNAGAGKNLISTYEEKDITQVSGVQYTMSSKVNSKNQIVVSNYNDENSKPAYITLDADGKRVGEIKADFEGAGTVFALDSKDNLYALSQLVVTEENSDKPKYTSIKLYIYSSDGKKINSIDLGKKDSVNEDVYRISDMGIDSKGNIYLLRFGSSIEVLDKDGKNINQFENSKYNSMAVCDDDNLVVTSWGGKGNEFCIEKLNTSSGQSLWKRSLIVSSGDQFVSCNKANKFIYVTDDNGIKKYDSSGKDIGYALKYASYSIPGLNRSISGICADAADNLYVLSRSRDFSEKSKEKPVILYKYSQVLNPKNDAAKEAEGKKEIGIALPVMQYISGNRFIDTAIKTFEQKYKDTKINIKEYGSAQDWSEQEKYIKTVSTEIMSGKGPDLIAINYLPYQRYIDKNILLDLDDFMKEDTGFKAGDYYTNILDACKYKGKLYGMPINFMFSVIIGDKDALKKESVSIADTGWTVDDFLAIAEKVTKDTNNDGIVDRYALPNFEEGAVFSCLGGSDTGRFVDYEKKEAHFTSKEFIDILKTTKEVIEKKLCNPEVKLRDVYDMSNRGGTVFISQGSWNYMSMYNQKAFFNGNGQIYHFPAATKEEKAAFEPQLFYGINKSTKYSKECWEFLKIMLSEELQASNDLPGYPLNIAAQKQRAEQMLGFENRDIRGKIDNKNLTPISQEDIDYMDKLVSELGRTSIMDTQVLTIVDAETKSFFSGTRSAEDAASTIQRKVETYLNE